jgi:site-specific DNA recombinase
MAISPAKPIRCAIYTRKSTDHGLEQEFNSLDAQREACEAYIKSQASQGWRSLPQPYDDAAYSGGNLDRPALRQLLKDIDTGLIDTVVVYKIDRLTRSLADFAKLVELFDARSISFVAVTQQFNTTTSMGRLTLNILLSFAQFERELSSERVRDKVAASRRKGIWTGGNVPLGYDSKGKKLVINQQEAKTIRMIFERYLVLKSFQRLIEELDKNGVVTKRREFGQGKMAGGVPFAYGSLAHLLKNRIYLGETGHNGKWFPGEHQAILKPETFDQVQQLLKHNRIRRTIHRHQNGALLAGLIFDDRGNRMSPSFSVKNRIRYPYYVSSALLRGRKANAGSLPRLPAHEIEAPVLTAARGRFPNMEAAPTHRDLVEQCIERVVVGNEKVEIKFKAHDNETNATIEIPWSSARNTSPARMEGGFDSDALTPSPQLVQAIVCAHRWVRLLTDGTHKTVESLAQSVNVHPKIVRNGIRMAFLSPDITAAILEGHQPTTLSLMDFKNELALGWAKQRRALEFQAS